MATLIAVYNSEGCQGRCDARCYNAATPHCDCICGGMNHGAGQAKATSNTQALAEMWIDLYKEQHSDLNINRADVPVLKGKVNHEVGERPAQAGA